MERSTSPIISSDILASQLNSKLPIYVSSADVAENPQMTQLLEDLSLKLNNSGALKDTQTKLNNATISMKQGRLRYLEEQGLHYFISNVLLKYSSSSSDKHLNEMCQALTISELQSYTDLPSLGHSKEEVHLSNTNGILNLSPKDITNTAQNLITNQHRQILANRVEAVLNNEWNKIYSFMFPEEEVNISKDNIGKICDTTFKLQKEISTDTTKLQALRAKNDILFYQVYTQLINYGQLLLTLVEGNRISDHLLVTLSHKYVEIQAQYFKLRCMELQILYKTYNSKTVPALKALSSNLSERHKKAEEEIIQLNHKLSAYSSLDPKFVSLLEEYTKLCKDIEFCQMNNSTLM